jgi:diguanylate cyclase (GGDEF)-like protein
MTLYKIKKDKIKHFSEYDALTEVFNRRVAFERLNKLYKELMKVQGKLSVCFIDINGLKEVNDYLGHDSGNELILSIVECIKKNTRDTDLIARLGGDEFLIIFNNMSAEDAEKVWTRISAEFDRINEEQNRKYVISASHGIEEFNIDTNKSIDVVVNQADEKMYREKRRIKKDETKIIRD